MRSRLSGGGENPRDTPICFPFDGAAFGGAVVSGLILATELANRGWPVVLPVHGTGRTFDRAIETGLEVVRLPALGRESEWQRQDALRFGNLARMPDCLRFLRARQNAIVHINDARMLRTWAIPSAMRRRHVVVHWRGTYRRSLSVGLGLRLASRIVAISHFNAGDLPAWAQRKTDIILNPFRSSLAQDEISSARQAVRSQLGLPDRAAVIGFFGNLIDRKRPHVLIDILKEVTHTSVGAPVYGLLCGGRIEPIDTLLDERLSDKELAGRTIEAGLVADPERWMAACDVIILPALDEPFGRVVVEAQAVGVPVIVSKQCGASEVVDHGTSGFVLDASDLAGWIAHVRMVLDDHALAERLVAGGREVAARLSVDEHVSRIEALYRKLMA